MTISSKRRRELVEEAKRFREAWRLAKSYVQAGKPVMAEASLTFLKMSKLSPAEKAAMFAAALKRGRELLAQEAERERQGLPPEENKKPPIH